MLYDPMGKSQQDLEGIEIEKISEGQAVVVETKNSTYTFTKTEGDRRVQVQGGKYFSDPTDAVLIGSTFGGSLIKTGWIGYSMHLEIAYGDTIIRTSPVKKATVKGHLWEYQLDWPEQP